MKKSWNFVFEFVWEPCTVVIPYQACILIVACKKGFYMDTTEQAGKCQKYPGNTNTTTEGSTSRRHCVCNKGYQGPAGGPCTGIRIQSINPVLSLNKAKIK